MGYRSTPRSGSGAFKVPSDPNDLITIQNMTIENVGMGDPVVSDLYNHPLGPPKFFWSPNSGCRAC